MTCGYTGMHASGVLVTGSLFYYVPVRPLFLAHMAYAREREADRGSNMNIAMPRQPRKRREGGMVGYV